MHGFVCKYNPPPPLSPLILYWSLSNLMELELILHGHNPNKYNNIKKLFDINFMIINISKWASFTK